MAELDGKFLNEQTYKKGKRVLFIIGFVVLAIGVALTIGGIVLLVKAGEVKVPSMSDSGWLDAKNSQMAKESAGAALLSVGIFAMFGSIVPFVLAYRRSILAYNVSSVAPVAGEALDYGVEHVAPAVEKVSEAIATGVAKGKEKSTQNTQATATKGEFKFCTECGQRNKKTARFCEKCGNKFGD